MKKIALTLLFVLIFQTGIFAQKKPVYLITAKSFGAVKTGMTIKQIRNATGLKFRKFSEAGNDCGYLEPVNGLRGVGFMMINYRMARVDIDSRNYRTAEGARVGDSEARIKKLYGRRVVVEPHKYTDGHYMTVGNKSSAIVFETDGKKVLNIIAGRYPEAGWVEGCS